MKTISVLFTQKYDWFSRFLAKAFRHRYSHVSLSLDNDKSEFYSFNVKGFVRETIDKFRRHSVQNSILYEIDVNDDAYNIMKDRIKEIKKQRSTMKYAFIGIALCLFNIPFHRKRHYFCSEFVAEMLTASHAVHLQKKPSQYLPERLRVELERCTKMNKLVNVI